MRSGAGWALSLLDLALGPCEGLWQLWRSLWHRHANSRPSSRMRSDACVLVQSMLGGIAIGSLVPTAARFHHRRPCACVVHRRGFPLPRSYDGAYTCVASLGASLFGGGELERSLEVFDRLAGP